MNIIMLGAQGTGKGTVAGLISEQTGLPQISTGDIFRKNIRFHPYYYSDLSHAVITDKTAT